MRISCSIWIQLVISFPLPGFFYLSIFPSGPSICLLPHLFLPLFLSSSESALVLVLIAALRHHVCFPWEIWLCSGCSRLGLSMSPCQFAICGISQYLTFRQVSEMPFSLHLPLWQKMLCYRHSSGNRPLFSGNFQLLTVWFEHGQWKASWVPCSLTSQFEFPFFSFLLPASKCPLIFSYYFY